MRNALLMLAAGLLSVRFLPALPPLGLLLALALIGLMCLPWRTYLLSFFLFGLCLACLSAQRALDDRLNPALDGRTVWLQGQVVGLPQQQQGTMRFVLENPTSRRGKLPARLRLSWHQGQPVQAGEVWRLAVTLKRPHGTVNPASFDYEAWLLAQRIGGSGTVKQGERISAAQGFAAFRDDIRQNLLNTPAYGRGGGLAALVVGDGSGLSRADWQLLQDTGTLHLMVISGGHVALLALAVYALIAGIARLGLWPARFSWLPVASVLAFAAALAYGLVAGFEVPVRRACLMMLVVLVWRLRFRHLGWFWPWLLALNAVLLIEPLASLQAGFWLSFIAAGLLLWLFCARLGRLPWWHGWIKAQWGMAIGLLPALLALGLPISLSAPFANLLAVPWIGFISVPLALLGTLLSPLPYLGEGLLWLAAASLHWLFYLLGLIAALLPAQTLPAAPLWAWLLGALGAGVLLLPSGIPLRFFGALLLAPLLLVPIHKPPMGQAEVWLLDVGQGLAVLLRTRDHAMLYDSGPSYGDFDSGERIVLPSLRRLGVKQLDLMLISHADNDHAGGAEAIMRAMPVAAVQSGEPARLPQSLNATPCIDGQSWQWDKVTFTTMHKADAKSSNGKSCLLKITANGERLLLTGDIDYETERALIAAGFDLKSDWLLAPHHGSKSSSSMALLKAVSPHSVLISRGAYNSYNHPHPQVLTRYQKLGIHIFDSSQTGAQRIELGHYQKLHPLREEQQRFWR
ncbi:competence protein ComEC [Ventosimonas gracilis]|uniref:Competence protein ComEC n=1 Tax=Ventosimonas gracilis TaxID=1680762 RepID=A0A139SS06_9GAMM|nr:DNA internalization-related competence protein ComEC/Rec2 [Ventosimonas gracilis]KXU37260.1 competence protein ComEC [Ventosimonas gracilis]